MTAAVAAASPSPSPNQSSASQLPTERQASTHPASVYSKTRTITNENLANTSARVSSESLQSHVEPRSVSEKDGQDRFLVLFDDADPENPQNWSVLRKWYLTVFGGLLVLNATFASAAPSGMAGDLMIQFGFGTEVASLTIALFVAGYCVGPLIWGPLSEQYGRRPLFIVPYFVYTCFQIGCALSPNTASIIIFRFLGGTFAAAPLTNSGAIISDIWDARNRGKAIGIFTTAPFAGPALGPIVAGYLSVAGVSWRWLFWILTILAGVMWLLIVFTLPETYAPVILVKKARRLRKETGDERYYAQFERNKLKFTKRLEGILARPFRMLLCEPMLLAVTVYMSFVYGCLYLLFEAYPIVFTEGHGLNEGASGLMFLPIVLGGVTSVTLYILLINPRYERESERLAPLPVPPEFRLEATAIVAPMFAAAFFWFGWTSFPSISYWAPMMAGYLLGAALLLIFLSLTNYIIDVYLYMAASALAANTVVRSVFGAAFPLFSTQMYDALGPRWASSLIGFVALAMIPIPFLLIKFGPILRARSKYAPSKPVTHPPKQSDSSPA